MKSLGFVRRMDSLGRIVIPKEIRKKLKIKEDDILELFLEENNIYIKKYTLFDNNMILIKKYGKILYNLINKNVIITNRDKIIYCNDGIIDTFLDKELTEEVINYIDKRIIKKDLNLEIIKNVKISNYFCYPIIVDSNSIGMIFLFDKEKKITEQEELILKLMSNILNQSLE